MYIGRIAAFPTVAQAAASSLLVLVTAVPAGQHVATVELSLHPKGVRAAAPERDGGLK